MQQNYMQAQQPKPVKKKKRPSTAKPKSKGKKKKKIQRMTEEEQLMQMIQQNPELMAQYQSEFDQIPEMENEEESPMKQEPAQSEPADS